jgi:hypothetical protein
MHGNIVYFISITNEIPKQQRLSSVDFSTLYIWQPCMHGKIWTSAFAVYIKDGKHLFHIYCAMFSFKSAFSICMNTNWVISISVILGALALFLDNK